eukprot:289282_1
MGAIHGTKTFVSDKKTFSQAKEYCINSYPDGHLASISDAFENLDVQQKCKNIGQLQTACWIGLTNPAISGNKWLDGTPITYTNWYDGGDGGYSQPCSTIRGDGKWHTVGYCETGGNAALPFVCEEVTYIGDQLKVGERIETGEGLRSSDKRFGAVMQSDGNFVVYKLDANSGRIVQHLWSTTINAHVRLSNGYEGRYMIYQGDNNFCMYDQNNVWKWCTMAHTSGQNIPTGKVIMQSDSNLCVYNGYNRFMWGTYQNGAPWANNVTPFSSMEAMEIGLAVILLLVLINILCVAYNFCYVRIKGKNVHSYGKVMSVESDTDV